MRKKRLSAPEDFATAKKGHRPDVSGEPSEHPQLIPPSGHNLPPSAPKLGSTAPRQNRILSDSFWEMAERFVNYIHDETGFHTIVCDERGIIRRAYEKQRIGNPHAGAQKILASPITEIAVTKEDAAHNPLIKEGLNCAIVIDGTKMATFGIAGDLRIVGAVARVAASVMPLWIEQQRQQELLKKAYDQLARELEERIQAEASVRESQRLLQGILDASATVIFVKDLQGRYLLVNRRFQEMFQVGGESVIGKTDYDLFPQDRADAFRAFDQRVLAVGKAMESEVIVPQQDGQHSYISIKAPLRDESGRAYAVCGISTDITERKRLSEQLREAQKMEVMGRLAGGVAHDFNNLMTIVTGYSELLRVALSSNPSLQEEVEQIYKAGEQANTLTRQLLAFTRRQMLQPRLLELNGVLNDMGKMLRRLVREDIELSILSAPLLGLIRADRGHIEQVIMNLVINARDAISEGGKITVAVGNVVLYEGESHPHLHDGDQPSAYVRLSVSDTGHGMDAETRARIFEPFFTTKEQGNGTGIGLATVKAIVDQAGGHITVESEPGRGSAFHICFPRAEGEIAEEKPMAAATPARGSETILVVEDLEGLRTLACEILSRNGYKVLAAENGREALLLSEKHKGWIDLMLTDIVMPQMGGRDVAKAISRSRPDLKILFMSGYTDETVECNDLLAHGQGFIDKPFHPEALLLKVREILDRPLDSLRSE